MQTNNITPHSSILTIMLLPLPIGVYITLSNCIKNKSVYDGIICLLLIAIFLTYNFFSIDNLHRAVDVIEHSAQLDELYLTDPLLVFMMWCQSFGLECSHFFCLFIFLIYFFVYRSFLSCSNNQLSGVLFGLVLFTLSLRNVMDLMFYTLSFTFVVYVCSSLSFRNPLWKFKYLLIIPIIFILHRGVLLYYLPAVGLYYLDLLNKRWINIIYLAAVYFAIQLLLSTAELPLFSNEIAASLSESWSHYSIDSDNRWAEREFELSGTTYFIQFYLVAFLYAILFVYTIFKEDKINSEFKMILFMFQCGSVMLINFWDTVTLAERDMAGLSLTSILVLYLLSANEALPTWFSPKKLLYVVIAFFLFHQFRASGEAVNLQNMFKSESYQIKQVSSYILPSGILLDYHDFGYSDKFIIENKQQ